METHRFSYLMVPVMLALILPLGALEADEVTKQTQTIDFKGLIGQLCEPTFWRAVGITMLFGAIGGFVYELIALKGMVEWIHKPNEEEAKDFPHATHKSVYDLGVFSRLVIGSTAALIALWVITPDSTLAWLAVAIVAGSAGTSVFQSLQDRLLAAIKSRQVLELKSDLKNVESQLTMIGEAMKTQQYDTATELAFAAKALAGRHNVVDESNSDNP